MIGYSHADTCCVGKDVLIIIERLELNCHADNCRVGKDVLIVHETQKRVKVTPFIKTLGSVNKIPIVSAAIAYDDQRSGQTRVFIHSSGIAV
jgi:hypothetical protein